MLKTTITKSRVLVSEADMELTVRAVRVLVGLHSRQAPGAAPSADAPCPHQALRSPCLTHPPPLVSPQIWVRKTSDSTKMRIYLGQLQRGLFVIRRRSAA